MLQFLFFYVVNSLTSRFLCKDVRDIKKTILYHSFFHFLIKFSNILIILIEIILINFKQQSLQIFQFYHQSFDLARQVYYRQIKMQQQTQITINFSQIFSPSNEQSIAPKQQILNRTFSQSDELQEQSQAFIHQTNSILLDNSTIKDSTSIRLKMAPSAKYQIDNINKLFGQMPVFKLKKSRSVDINKITKRLTENQRCSKLRCSKYINAENLNNHDIQIKVKKRQTSIVSERIVDEKNGIISSNVNRFQRLHNLSKINTVKQLYLKTQLQGQNYKKIIQNHSKAKQKYLKNYIPFYKRLQSQVNRSFQRERLIQKNPQYGCNDATAFFKPTILPSRYSSCTKSRYLTPVSRFLRSEQVVDFMNSSVNTQISGVQRSAQMANQVEQHFINKMKLIFLEEGQDLIQIKSEAIVLLTDVQFSILHPFIEYLEQNSIPANSFELLLRQFCDSLSISQKRNLINHEVHKRLKYRESEIKAIIKPRNEQKKLKQSTSQLRGLSKLTSKNSKYSGDYHFLIQKYI